MERITHVFSRATESTFAVVSCNKTEDTYRAEDFLDNLKNAVTEWIKSDQTGSVEWRNSSEDLNIGDIAMHIGTDFVSKAGLDLSKHLKKFGIEDLGITVFSGEEQALDFDNILINKSEL